MVLEVLTFTGSNLGSSLAAVTAVSGDSATIRNFGGSAGLLQVWGHSALTGSGTGIGSQERGEIRIFSPEMHDTVNGIRVTYSSDFDALQGASGSQAGISDPLLPDRFFQPLNPQQALTVQASGDSATVTGVGLLLHYDSLLGISQRLIAPSEALTKFINIAGIQVTLGAGLAYSTTTTAINATNDQFRANTDYAILGYTGQIDGTVLGIKGPDTGLIHVGGPVIPGRAISTRSWFTKLSDLYGKPMVPVFNSANKSTTLVELQNVLSITEKVNILVAQLGSAASA